MELFNLKLISYSITLCTLLLTSHVNASTAFAIDSPKVSQPVANNQNNKAVSPASPKPEIQPGRPEILNIKIQDISQNDFSTGKNRKIKVDYKIRILISHPKELLLLRPMDKSQLILFADEFPLKGISTVYFTQISRQDALDPTRHWPDSLWVPFLFKRDSTNKEAWNSIFHLSRWNNNTLTFHLSLGWEGMFPLQNANDRKLNSSVVLELYNKGVFIILILVYLSIIAIFIYLCHSTGLIRDPDRVSNSPGPYSLSQTQLTFWTVVILGGFIYLIILTGLTDSLNDTALLLLGISGSTTGLASFIDYYKKKSTNQVQAAAAPAVDQGQAAADPTATPVQAISYKQHRTFLLDILSDGINISVQRTQTVTWNFVLGIYFIWYVITNKSMPVFSNTLLLLAGVSSLLYLSSKGPENPTPASPLKPSQ